MRKDIVSLPNMFTLFNLLCGFLAILYVVSGHYGSAAVVILLGMGFDFLDGYTARALHKQSELGGQFDSFADMTTFGLAPAILIFAANYNGVGFFYRIALFLYLCAIICRLADYNISEHDVNFRGLPSTFSGGFIAFVFLWAPKFFTKPVSGLLFIGLAALSVSKIPYAKIAITPKSRKVLIICIAVAGILFKLYAVLLLCFLIYLLSGFYLLLKGPTDPVIESE